MKLRVTAPTRIDLAGGTLDIYPLYIFQGGGLTVNMAISPESVVEIETRSDGAIRICSADLGCSGEYESVEALETGGELDLLIRAVRFFRPCTGLNIRAESSVPKGSGLAASSSLLVALMYGLGKICGRETDPHRFIDWCANVEAACLGIPTGKQDYYAAYFGGISAISFQDSCIEHRHLNMTRGFVKMLPESLVLSFTGISHFSGTNNWNMMKRCIDDEDTRRRMGQIALTALKMQEAVESSDLQRIASVLEEEWRSRKELAEGVSNERIDGMMKAAKEAGALASKICGAGGGGCMATLCEPRDREKVKEALKAQGGEILDFRMQEKGVQAVEIH